VNKTRHKFATFTRKITIGVNPFPATSANSF